MLPERVEWGSGHWHIFKAVAVTGCVFKMEMEITRAKLNKASRKVTCKPGQAWPSFDPSKTLASHVDGSMVVSPHRVRR